MARAIGWQIAYGPEIAPGDAGAEERQSYQEAIFPRRLRDTLVWLNFDIPAEAIEGAFRKISRRLSFADPGAMRPWRARRQGRQVLQRVAAVAPGS